MRRSFMLLNPVLQLQCCNGLAQWTPPSRRSPPASHTRKWIRTGASTTALTANFAHNCTRPTHTRVRTAHVKSLQNSIWHSDHGKHTEYSGRNVKYFGESVCTNCRRIAGTTKHVSLRTVFEEINPFYSFLERHKNLHRWFWSSILKFDFSVKFDLSNFKIW